MWRDRERLRARRDGVKGSCWSGAAAHIGSRPAGELGPTASFRCAACRRFRALPARPAAVSGPTYRPWRCEPAPRQGSTLRGGAEYHGGWWVGPDRRIAPPGAVPAPGWTRQGRDGSDRTARGGACTLTGVADVSGRDPWVSRPGARAPPRRAGAPGSDQPTRCSCGPSRLRADDAVRASTSRSPRTSMYGTFCSCARRILFCIRLSESSTSTTEPARPQHAGQLVGGLVVAVGDRDDDRLHRRAPERERAREVLGEHADEPLERAVDRAVDRDRPLRARRARRCSAGRSARAASRGRPGSSPSATRGRGRPRSGCRSWARRTRRPSP